MAAETRQSFKCVNCSCRVPSSQKHSWLLPHSNNKHRHFVWLLYYQQAVCLHTCLLLVYSKHVLAVLVSRLGLRQHPSLVAHHYNIPPEKLIGLDVIVIHSHKRRFGQYQASCTRLLTSCSRVSYWSVLLDDLLSCSWFSNLQWF